MIRNRTRSQVKRAAAEKRSKQNHDRPSFRASRSSPEEISSSETSPVHSPERSAAAPTENGSVPSSAESLAIWNRIREQRLLSNAEARRHAYRRHTETLEEQFPSQFARPDNPLSFRFLNQHCQSRFFKIQHRSIYPEKSVFFSTPESKGIMDIIEENGLLLTVSDREVFYPNVVYEVYAHLTSTVRTERPDLIYVRGKMYEFSPAIINKTFNTPDIPAHTTSEFHLDISDHALVQYLTGDRIHHWTKFNTSMLTPEMGHLYGICCYNWMPSSNNTNVTKDRAKLLYKLANRIPFNFGKLVYDQIKAVAVTMTVKGIVPFPSLIYQVLRFQKEILSVANEHMVPPLAEFQLDDRRGHVRQQTPAPAFVFGRSLIADLRHTSTLLLDIAKRFEGGDYGEALLGSAFDKSQAELSGEKSP
ncbi:unnamed protein product [Microthlaspi erraticum]|uniref:Putative plant transposon protein domain-containing protein n=1 Tax=Microthlaspi erraticum TaxID=1685480 RepID=A0A6D2IRP1_9BRAS|nr:unnamed protein product [Microthlaspi erraticum]